MRRSVTSWNRSSEVMVISEISRAMARRWRWRYRHRLRQSRGVVDAVTDHDDRVSGGTLPADEVCLILRQDLGVELVHPYLLRHTGGGTAVVAGHHDHLADAAVVERTDGVLGLGPKIAR